MKWESFTVDAPKSESRYERFEFIARRGLGDALKAYELSELAIQSCTQYRDHLGVVLQSARAAGLASVLSALDHSFRWLGPQVIPRYKRSRYEWRRVGWLMGHLWGLGQLMGETFEQVSDELDFLKNAVLVRNQHAHYHGSIVGCPERSDVELWLLREPSLWIDENAVICFAGDAVGKAFDNACSLVLYLTWRLREWEQV